MSKRRRVDPTTSSPFQDSLVPIRLDLTVEGHRIQETFQWNVYETAISPSAFVAHLISDLGLPASAHEPVLECMQEQISSFSPHVPPENECRHVVHLSLRLGRVMIRDQFEWDLNCAENSAEPFAERLCADLGLGTEHVPAVAHAVREQLVEVQEFREKRKKCAVLKGEDVVRKGFHPTVEWLSKEEEERLERKEKREARLVRRNRGKVGGRGGGGSGGRRRSDSSLRRRA